MVKSIAIKAFALWALCTPFVQAAELIRNQAAQPVPVTLRRADGSLISSTVGVTVTVGVDTTTLSASAGTLALDGGQLWYTPTAGETNGSAVTIRATHAQAAGDWLERFQTGPATNASSEVSIDLSEVASANDFWATLLASLTTEDSIGKHLVDNLDAILTDTSTTLPAAIDAIEGDIAASTGGGIAFAMRVGTFDPKPAIMDVVQGEARNITLLVQARNSWANSTPEDISVTLKDDVGNTVTIPNADITRVCEDGVFQIIRFQLTAEDSATLDPGFVRLEAKFDDERAQQPNAIRIVEAL